MMVTTYKKDPIEGTVRDIKPVEIKMVRQTSLEPLWNELVRDYHYLGHGRMPGANLKYLAFCGDSPLAALSFRAASLKLKPRDCFIGWSLEQRSQHLPQLANSNRFLILPWVRVKNLGSYLLSQVTRQLIQDWFCYYEQRLLQRPHAARTYRLGPEYCRTSFHQSRRCLKIDAKVDRSRKQICGLL